MAALVASGLLLYDTNSSAFEISAPVVIAVAVVLGGLLAVAVERAVRARRLPKHTGWEEMVGAVGEVRQPLDPVGQVFVAGSAVARPRSATAPPTGRASAAIAAVECGSSPWTG